MQILKIEDNIGKFSTNGNDFENIVTIDKEKLKCLIDIVMKEETIILDEENDSDKKISNKAEQIIYKNIYTQINKLIGEKENIISSVNNYFSNFVEKYDLQGLNEE